jgi:hypothetical protein
MLTVTKTDIKDQELVKKFLMPPNYASYEQFIDHCINEITIKVQSIMDDLSIKMNARLKFGSHSILDGLNDFLVIALMKICFKKEVVDEQTFCVATFNGILSFECGTFDFKFNQSYSYFHVIVNEKLELTAFEYSTVVYDKQNVNKRVNLKFDQDANLTEYLYKVDSTFFGWSVERLKSKDMLCLYSDELFLHNSIAHRTPLMDELFPELSVIGVYDFSSPEFKRKLTLFEMSLI